MAEQATVQDPNPAGQPSAAGLVEAGLAGKAEPAGGDRGDPGKPATQVEAPISKPAEGLTPAEEIRQLRDRLTSLEDRESGLAAQRRAVDTTEDFIREQFGDYTRDEREFLRKFLPTTADRGVLEREARKFRDVIGSLTAAKSSFGGGGGGTPVNRTTGLPPQGTAAELVADGLRSRAHQPNQFNNRG